MGWLAFWFSFEGRVSRLGLWRANLVYAIYLAAVALVAAVLVIAGAPMLIAIAAAGPVILSYLAVTVKRLHDRNMSGWWFVAFNLAPFAALSVWQALNEQSLASLPVTLGCAAVWLFFFVWSWLEIGVFAGTPGPNDYGPQPTLRRTP
jgi:uncharacterized membrane protein YhaH (DUF805 family)